MFKIKIELNKLENFDLETLDLFEKQLFDNLSESMNKAEALEMIINNAKDDYSQLSDSLLELVEECVNM